MTNPFYPLPVVNDHYTIDDDDDDYYYHYHDCFPLVIENDHARLRTGW